MSTQEHKFLVTVSGCTAEQAGQVMGERIGYDEDYGFEYQIEVANAPAEDTVEFNVQLPQSQIPYITELGRLSGQPVEVVIAVLLAAQASKEQLAIALAQGDNRSPKDYAIEHAGYLVTAVRDLLTSLDERDMARVQLEEDTGSEDAVDATQEALMDSIGVVRTCLYEFEKRRDRALLPEPAPETASSEGLYYLQDSRSYVGNCPMWWGPFGCGYTTRLDRAHRYTYEQAMKQHRIRSTDIPWPCSKIDPLRRPTIDMQDLGSVRDQIARLNDNQLGQT